MKRPITFIFLSIFILVALPQSRAQNLPSIITDLCGGKWTGNYQNSEDSSLLHVLEWRIEYDGKVARAYKSVPELDFFMETTIYYDYEHDCFTALSLLNKSMISKGEVTGSEKDLQIHGKNWFRNGNSEFRIQYKLNEKGQLEDRFFRKVNGEWTEGHFILYDIVNVD